MKKPKPPKNIWAAIPIIMFLILGLAMLMEILGFVWAEMAMVTALAGFFGIIAIVFNMNKFKFKSKLDLVLVMVLALGIGYAFIGLLPSFTITMPIATAIVTALQPFGWGIAIGGMFSVIIGMVYLPKK